MWVVILERDGGDFARTRRLGLARFETAVRREIVKRDGQKPCLRMVRKLYSALADPTGVTAHRCGALERVQLLLEDWAETQRKLVDTETRISAVLDEPAADRAGHQHLWAPRLAPRRSWPRPATPSGAPPQEHWSSTPAWHRGRRSPAPSQARRNSPAKADRWLRHSSEGATP
jgi:hypothetical protein